MTRTLPWDWYRGSIPENVVIDEAAFVETSFSFHCYRSRLPRGVEIGRGASTYLGTMFDVGPRGRVRIGDYALVHGARIICDREVEIGDHALISWNVVLMDSYRVPIDVPARRRALERVADRSSRLLDGETTARAVHVEPNVWLAFGVCVLPGVRIGRGSIVGAQSVVCEDVPPYCVAAGNPARVVRRLEARGGTHGG
jgi:acetyltransferase-like isoleucine patch superfamily enzyme